MTATPSDDRKPDYVYFISEAPPPAAGTTQEHFGIPHLFGRPKEAVEQDWRDTVSKAIDLVSQDIHLPGNLSMDEIQFQLGFSAQGQLAFIAQAGITASVTITFRRT